MPIMKTLSSEEDTEGPHHANTARRTLTRSKYTSFLTLFLLSSLLKSEQLTWQVRFVERPSRSKLVKCILWRIASQELMQGLLYLWMVLVNKCKVWPPFQPHIMVWSLLICLQLIQIDTQWSGLCLKKHLRCLDSVGKVLMSSSLEIYKISIWCAKIVKK